MKSELVFDLPNYQELNACREAVLRRLVGEWQQRVPLKTAIDLGCGPGYFSGVLASLGLSVVGVDAREENILEARARFPNIPFKVIDAEDPQLIQLGSFDLVLCFGLIYHLENPFRVIRNIAALASKVSVLEGMVYPSPEPILCLLDENVLQDQSVNYVACYPTESCLAKMLYRSGFSECWLPAPMPAHSQYQPQKSSFRARSMMIASKVELPAFSLEKYPRPSDEDTPWNMRPLYALRGVPYQLQALLRRYFYPTRDDSKYRRRAAT